MSPSDYLCFLTTPMNDKVASTAGKGCIPIVRDSIDEGQCSHQMYWNDAIKLYMQPVANPTQ